MIEQKHQVFTHPYPGAFYPITKRTWVSQLCYHNVEDNGEIAQIQGRFHEDATLVLNYSIEGEDWLPHLSIAALKNLTGLSALKTEMDRLRRIDIGEVQATHIDLSQAILQKSFPKFRILQTFSFAH